MNSLYAALKPTIDTWELEAAKWLKENEGNENYNNSFLNQTDTLNSVDDKPFFINTFRVMEVTWFHNGVMHRGNGEPSLITLGDHYSAEWHENGCYHRADNKPALISTFQNIWAIRGMLHRTNGSALIEYDYSSSVIKQKFYLYGKELHKVDYNFIIKKAARLNLPVWLCLLHKGRLIDDVSMSLLSEELRSGVPIAASWILKSINLDNQTLEEFYYGYHGKKENLPFQSYTRDTISDLLAVIDFEVRGR